MDGARQKLDTPDLWPDDNRRHPDKGCSVSLSSLGMAATRLKASLPLLHLFPLEASAPVKGLCPPMESYTNNKTADISPQG